MVGLTKLKDERWWRREVCSVEVTKYAPFTSYHNIKIPQINNHHRQSFVKIEFLYLLYNNFEYEAVNGGIPCLDNFGPKTLTRKK